MVPQSGRKGLWPDNRFSMNPALPDSLYHSAARIGFVRAFVCGAAEKCCRIFPESHYTIETTGLQRIYRTGPRRRKQEKRSATNVRRLFIHPAALHSTEKLFRKSGKKCDCHPQKKPVS